MMVLKIMLVDGSDFQFLDKLKTLQELEFWSNAEIILELQSSYPISIQVEEFFNGRVGIHLGCVTLNNQFMDQHAKI